MTSDIFKQLKDICPKTLKDEPMNIHTTFKIGGPADFFCKPADMHELTNLIRFISSENLPYIISGNGSNMLISDKGIEGVIINISDNFSDIMIKNNIIYAGAGVLMSKLAKTALASELMGLEFASGIPGSLGGAVYMNAGAYGNEMKDIIKSVTYIDPNGIINNISKNNLNFGYRKSFFTDKNLIILSCELELSKGKKEEIASKMAELSAKRSSKQPLNMPSAGSVFKRPEGNFAGTLIENAGLKGYSIGGAKVSEKHAGFIINSGNATAAEVTALIEYIVKTVEEKFSVRLEPEIRLIGR